MAIDTIKSSAVLDGAIATVDIADDAVTGAKIENNPTIAGNLTVSGNTTASGTLGVTGDLTVDTSSLKVNASNNFIGIGTASPQKKIHILDTTSDGNMIFDRNGTSTDHQIIFAHNYQSGGQSGGNYYGIGVDGSENKLVFAYDANSQASLSADAKMTLNSSGVLSVPSGVELGLNFAGAASNTLDDYEEGTYTPVLASSGCTFSYSVQLGSYVKIGNFVYLQFNITLSNRTGTLNNVVFLDNVPFLTKNVDNSLYSGGHIGHYFNINLNSGTTIAYQLPAVSTNQIELKEVGDNIGENGIVASELNTNAIIRGSVMYRAAT